MHFYLKTRHFFLNVRIVSIQNLERSHMHRETESVINISVVTQNWIECMLYASLRVYRRKTGFYSWLWCLVDRKWKRVSFVRKSANVASRIVERKG